MITHIPWNTRWQSKLDWLTSFHSFSFGWYRDPSNMGFGVLRVINDDMIAPWQWFWEHPHDNMEIITIPISWELMHRDSMWHEEVLKAGSVQTMTAGSGLTHSEHNHSQDKPLHILQIWIEPEQRDLAPSHSSKFFDRPPSGSWQLLASPDSRSHSLQINQNAFISQIYTSNPTTYTKYKSQNGIFVFIVEWTWSIGGNTYGARDAFSSRDESEINIVADTWTRTIVLEVPM